MPARPKNTGFWGYVEAYILSLQEDPEKAARHLRIVWYLSLVAIAVGFVIMFYILALGGSWPP